MYLKLSLARLAKGFCRLSEDPLLRVRQARRGVCTVAALSRSAMNPRAEAVLDYWLGEGWASAGASYLPAHKSKLWFMGGPEVDKEITEQFGPDCDAFAAGSYDDWKNDLLSCVGGIVLADQMTRNVYRGSPKMYQSDVKGLSWAKLLVSTGQHSSLRPLERIWVYMPFMHSEVLHDQEECIALFKSLVQDCSEVQNGEALVTMAQENVKYAQLHRDVILRWGRFPHRNSLLGRKNTPGEAVGLADGSIPKF